MKSNNKYELRLPDRFPVRSWRLIFSGCGEDSELENAGCSFVGLMRNKGARMTALVFTTSM